MAKTRAKIMPVTKGSPTSGKVGGTPYKALRPRKRNPEKDTKIPVRGEKASKVYAKRSFRRIKTV